MKNNALNNLGLLVLRLSVGALMIPHGWSKVKMLLDGNSSMFMDPIGIGKLPSLILSGGAEFICSIFIIIGFLPRLSALALLVNMIVAFTVTSGASREIVLLYSGVYAAILLAGSGEYSLSAMLSRKSESLKKLKDF